MLEMREIMFIKAAFSSLCKNSPDATITFVLELAFQAFSSLQSDMPRSLYVFS